MTKKYCRFEHENRPVWGELEGEKIRIIEGDLFADHRVTDSTLPLSGARLLAPVTPTKIICVGLNYREHVKESKTADKVPDEPVLFTKPLTSLIAPKDEIIYPPQSERVDYEGEIGVVIGSLCTRVPASEAAAHVFGCTCVNDVTARDLQRKDIQWTRAKGFDTFCPVGPYLVTGLEFQKLDLCSRLNGEVRQKGNSSDMIFTIPWLISYISAAITLMPGDLLVTGTPQGIGPMQPGDVVEVEVQGVGVLKNRVAKLG